MHSNHPRAHTVKLGRMTTHKNPPTPCHAPKSGLIRPLRPHCSQALWCYPMILRCATNTKLAKISSHIESDFQNGFFSTLHTYLKVKLHENAFDAASGSRDAWRRPTVGGNCVVGLESMVKIATLACSLDELGKDKCKTRWEIFKFGDSVHFTLEVWR